MSLSIVGHSSYVNTNNTDVTTVVIPQVSGIASGDFMVAIVSGPYTGSLTWTPPSGWTLVNSANTGAVSLESRFYTKVATGSEPSTYTWTCSGAGSMNGGIIAYRGTNGFTTVSSSTNPKVTTGTTANPQSMPTLATNNTSGRTGFCVSWHASGGSGWTATGNAGTEQWDVQATDGGGSTHNRGSAAYSYNTSFSSGSNNAGTETTLTGSPSAYIAWTWAIQDINSATVAYTLGGTTGDFAGTVVPGGPLAATLGGTTASMAGTAVPGGPLAATLGGVTASFEGNTAGVRVELLIDGTWTEVTGDVRYDAAVSLTTGRTAEGTTMTTTIASFTLDNRTSTVQNRYSLRNASGPYYGLIGRNTRVRIHDLEYGYRFQGEVASWEPGADSTNGDQYVRLECSGIVRRLSAGSPPTYSAMYREVMANSPVAYWPCDEGEGATSFASPLAGVPNLGITNGQSPDFGDYTALKTAGRMPQVNASSWRTPIIQGTSLTNGVTVAFLLASPGGITNGTRLMRTDFQYVATGVIYPWSELTYSDTNELSLNVYPLVGSAGTITGTVPIVGHNGVMVYVAYGINGSGDIKFGLWYQREDDATPILIDTSSWAVGAGDSLGDLISLRFNPNGTDLSSNSAAYMGQIAVWDGYGPGGTLEYASVGAYAGEKAGTRFARLCTEEGITHTVNNPSNSSAMGAQNAKTTLDLLRECEATDMGIMYELRDDFGLGYVVRRDLYNQDAALELNYSTGDLDSQLQPVFDDKGLTNDVTVQRIDGGSARYEVTDGALSTQDTPDGVGSYASSVSVSLWLDEQCHPQAGWRAHLGTVDEERITSLGVALENQSFQTSSTLRHAAMNVMPGSRITVTNCPDWTTDVDQIVQGYSERFDQFTHDITYNTSSAAPYDTATAAVTPTSTTTKADSLTSTLHTDIDSDDTSVSVTVTGVLWSTTAGDFDIGMDGEQMTVTAVSGTSSPQTFTVTRAVNGISKAHTAGTQIRLWRTPTVGL